MIRNLAFYAAFLLLVAPLLTGCMCTNAVYRHIGMGSSEKFKPFAVYRRENPVGFALEGTRETRRGSYTAFLIVDDYPLAQANAQSNQTLSVEDIQKAYERFALERDDGARSFEERVVIVEAPNFEQAIAVGEAEAKKYVSEMPVSWNPVLIDDVQAFEICANPIRPGDEVWSVIRHLNMTDTEFRDYLSRGDEVRSIKGEPVAAPNGSLDKPPEGSEG